MVDLMKSYYFLKAELDEILEKLQMPPTDSYIVYDNAELNAYLSYCRGLDLYEEEILKLKNTDLTILLFSKYYWHGMAEIRHFNVYGNDAGMEQQTFQVLEEIENRITDVDWNVVEEIYAAYEKERIKT